MSFKPRFVRRYEHLGARITEAAKAYIDDVKDGSFPSDAESFALDEGTRASGTNAPLYSSGGAKNS